LRCFTGEKPGEWVKWLSWVGYTYNTGWHSSIEKTLFELVYGHSAPNLLSYIPGTARVEAMGQMLGELDEVLLQVRVKLCQAENRMKQLYDKGHTKREF
jgi:hypothetical protein